MSNRIYLCSLHVSETAEWVLNTRYRIVPCVAACAVLGIVGVECVVWGGYNSLARFWFGFAQFRKWLYNPLARPWFGFVQF